jgi:alkyldihydroxyacetonephosphate synthase
LLDPRTLKRIRAAVGLDGLSARPSDLLVYSTDLWPRANVLKLSGQLPAARPDAVVWPRTPEALARALAVAAEAGIAVVPYGAGSGVCGGTVPVREGLVIDVKRMNRLVSIDDVSLTVDVEAGMNGQHLEEALNERGFTLGHFPSSIMCSTVGGWIACRSAGQYSSRYGKIEDMVLSMDVALPDGSIVAVDGTQPHPGAPDWCQLLLGSEGTLGIVLRARLRIHPLPATRRFRGFRFMQLEAGLEAMRDAMQAGLRPSVMRLYDPLDTFINNFSAWLKGKPGGGTRAEPGGPFGRAVAQLVEDAGGLASSLSGSALKTLLAHPALLLRAMDRMPIGCMLVTGFEGEDARVRTDIEAMGELARRAGGSDLGPGPGEHWYSHRYSVSFKLTRIFGIGAFAETLEVAGLWRDVPRIYREVREGIRNRVVVMAHFSHAYREGCALYFTVSGAASDPKALPELYDWTVKTALARAMGAGSTASHHHGIGIMKRDWAQEDFRGGGTLYAAIKAGLDPSGLMNPQKIYPPAVPFDESERDDLLDDDHAQTALSMRGEIGEPVETRPDVPEEIPELLKMARDTGRRLTCQCGPRRGPREPGASALDLSRLDEILEMDPVSGTVTVQAGMTVKQIDNFLKEKGFTIGFAPVLRRHLTVGEYLAEAAPGEGSPLYGTIRENCVGMSAVLADGSALSVRPSPRRSSGPDLMHCLIGSRGRYGVITAACFRVFPVPAVREALAFGTDDPVIAVSTVRTVLVRGARPEWILVVVRAPSALGGRRRVRVVFQCGGTREAVSADLAIVRDMVDPIRLEEEPVRLGDRLHAPPKKLPAMERWLSMRGVMDVMGRMAAHCKSSCPEAHVTHLTAQGPP